MPLISVLMPVYNATATLESTVESIRRQTMPDWELILVNDCSTDDSAAVCDRLAAADDRIRVVHLEHNGGAGPARNLALTLATGDYVAMFDSDDTVEEDLFEQALGALQTHGVQTVVWGLREEYIGADGEITRCAEITVPFAVCHTADEVHRQLLALEARTLLGYCSNKLYRRDILAAQGIVSPNLPLYEDFLFNATYAPHITSLVVLDRAMYHYKKHSGSLTSRFVPEYFPLSQMRVRTMWELCEQWGIADDEARRVLGGIYVRYIFSALQRNCDKRMGLSAAARRTFLKELYNEPLFLQLVPHAAPEGRAMAALSGLLKRRMTGVCLLAGRALHMVKNGLPQVFSKAAQN